MIGSYQITEIRGVPVRVHFTVFLMLFLFGGGGIVWTLYLCLAVLLSVALHELGHTVVSQRYGVNVRDIILTPVGGVARLEGLPENPRHEIRVALAGPYVSLLLFLLGFILYLGFANLRMRFPAEAAAWFAGLNLVLLLFNLLPSFPMDGGRVLRGWLSQRKGALEATRIASQVGKYMSIAFIVLGLSSGNYSLAVIGLFIFMAAGSEYRMMQVRDWQERQFGGAADPQSIPETEFQAGPPPYETKSASRAMDGFLGDVVQTWKDLFEETVRTCLSR